MVYTNVPDVDEERMRHDRRYFPILYTRTGEYNQ